MPIEQQVFVIYAATKGYMDDVPLNRINEFQNALLTDMNESLAPAAVCALVAFALPQRFEDRRDLVLLTPRS